MSRSDHATGQISTYRFPNEVSIDRLLVRPPLDADIDEIAPAFRDPAVGGEAGLPPVDADTLRVMLHEQLPGLHAQGLLAAYVIEDTETGKLLGGASLHHFDPLRDVVEIGYWLFVEARGLGVATRVVRKLTDHAFHGGIWRVEAHVRVGNTASERVLERLDFVREGVKRQIPAPRGRTRRRDAVRAARRRRLKALVVYLMSGSQTPELAAAAVEGGADIVELGFPFSDPLADGPVIRRAAERALAEGMRTRACFECLERTHELVPDVPLVPMTYAALLEAYGWERFATDARDAGASSMIVADLPAGERPELKRIQLVAPTSTDARLRIAADETDGWLYLVTVTGTTGARADLSPALAGLVTRARAVTDAPLYAGFGISTPDHARAAAELADGIVVGSRAVEVAEDGPEALRDYVRTLREGVDSVVAN